MTLGGFLLMGGFAAMGAWLRWACGLWMNGQYPWGTLFVNALGGLLAGVLMSWALKPQMLGNQWPLILAVGFLGSLTTFSSFSVEAVRLFETGHWLWGVCHIFAHNFLALGLCGLSYTIARGVWS